jgi:hypothetical protein
VVGPFSSSSDKLSAELHWVNGLSKSPILAEYVSGNRQLACLYLDTTFASLNESTKEFPDRVSFQIRLRRYTYHM